MSTVNITAQDINKLRQATGAGMMDCRKALTESAGDFEAAIDWLRKQGQKVAAKRSDREAKEGVIIAQTSADNKTGFIVCISCETDFVSKNAEFVAFAQSIADAAVANNVKSAEELNEVSFARNTNDKTRFVVCRSLCNNYTFFCFTVATFCSHFLTLLT